MCGIFAALGTLPDGALDAVSEALAHRGPDLAAHRIFDSAVGHVSLLHRRLSIIDLSPLGAQPMSNDDQSIWIVFNGEIYNHKQLRVELEALGHKFRSRSDTEAIIHGYAQWGDQIIERLDGMFALVLWDKKTNRLLAARDRTGKKPLFYAEQNGVLRLASTIESLRASGLQTRLDTKQLPFYLAYGFVPPPGSFYDAVRQLPPASYLSREPSGEIRTHVYWQPHFAQRPGKADSYDAACKKVRTLVEAAVERRLESDVPLGAFLSGGIDSSIIVGVMARVLGQNVKTFSIGFSGDARYDETHYARIAAKAFGTDHTEFTLEPSSFELVEKLVWHHDGPFGDSSAIPTSVVAQLTRKHVTVALTGDGGDELFCGYERFLAAEAAERIPLPLRRVGLQALAFLPTTGRSRSILNKAARFLDASALPLSDRMARLNSFFFEPAQLLRPELVAELGPALDAPLAWQRAMFSLARGASPLKQILEHNFRTYLPFDLNVKADRCSMAHGLELRAPFLDRTLIDYVTGLPDGYLRRALTTKRILKDAFADLLPPEILHRGKMGFGVPLGAWFRGNLRSYLRDHLGKGASIYQYLDERAVETLLAEHESGKKDHGQKLWLLLTLDIWLRKMQSQANRRAA